MIKGDRDMGTILNKMVQEDPSGNVTFQQGLEWGGNEEDGILGGELLMPKCTPVRGEDVLRVIPMASGSVWMEKLQKRRQERDVGQDLK